MLFRCAAVQIFPNPDDVHHVVDVVCFFEILRGCHIDPVLISLAYRRFGDLISGGADSSSQCPYFWPPGAFGHNACSESISKKGGSSGARRIITSVLSLCAYLRPETLILTLETAQKNVASQM